MLHQLREASLVCGRRQSANICGSSKDHVKIDTVISTAGRIEASVIPVSHVSVSPGWHSVIASGLGLVGHGAGERFQEERHDLIGCRHDARGEGGNAVVSVLVVVVSQQERHLCKFTSVGQ